MEDAHALCLHLSEAAEMHELTPEEEVLLLKIRADKLAAEKGKVKENEQAEKEVEDRAKIRGADALLLKALQLEREEIELQDKALREALQADETVIRPRKDRRGYDEEDESDSDSNPKRKRTKQRYSSDLDEELDGSRIRLTRLEKAMLGDMRVDREPIVTEEIEQYRPPPGEERQFPKKSGFNGKGDPEDHCEKYEILMIGIGHNDIMLCKMLKTYLKGSLSMLYKFLKPMSIGSYEQLKRKFLKYYSHLCRKAKDTEALVHCRQRANEELVDYLARFKEQSGMVTNLNKVKRMGFLTLGLDLYKGTRDIILLFKKASVEPFDEDNMYIHHEMLVEDLELSRRQKTKKPMFVASDSDLSFIGLGFTSKNKKNRSRNGRIGTNDPRKLCNNCGSAGHLTHACRKVKVDNVKNAYVHNMPNMPKISNMLVRTGRSKTVSPPKARKVAHVTKPKSKSVGAFESDKETANDKAKNVKPVRINIIYILDWNPRTTVCCRR
ncbi:hypothetical protein AgCh_024321 [Apium graveolens]